MSLPGPMELLVVLLVALIVLGPERLGTTARQAGRYYKQFREVTTGVQTEMRDLFEEATRDDDDPSKPPAHPASPASELDTPVTPAVPDSTVNTDATLAGSAPLAPETEAAIIKDADTATADVDTPTDTVVDPDVVQE